MNSRLLLIAVLALGIFIGVATSSKFLSTSTTPVYSHQDRSQGSASISAEALLELTQRVNRMAESTVSNDTKVGFTPNISAAVAAGKTLVCSDYVSELQRLLWQQNIYSEAYAIGLDSIAITNNNTKVLGYDHVLLSVGPYVADPTVGVVYTHAFSDLVANPYLADDFIGTPPDNFRTITGARFFSVLNKITAERDMHGIPLQGKYQNTTLVAGEVFNSDIKYLYDNDLTLPSTFKAANHQFVADYSFTAKNAARSAIIIPDWARFQPPKKVSFLITYEGEEQAETVVLDGKKDYRQGGYYIMLDETKPIKHIRFLMEGFAEADSIVPIAEIAVTGHAL